MHISQTTTNNKESNTPRRITRGEMAYACARNQHQFHDLIVRAIKDSGMSQKELAQLAGIDEATLSRIIARPRNLEINTISKLVFGARGATLSMSLAFPGTKKSTVSVKKTDRFFKFSAQIFPLGTAGEPANMNSGPSFIEKVYA